MLLSIVIEARKKCKPRDKTCDRRGAIFVSGMEDFINVIGDISFRQVKVSHDERFRQQCFDRGNKPATVAKELRHIKRFIQLAVVRNQLEENPLRHVKQPRCPKPEIRVGMDAARLDAFAAALGNRRGCVVKDGYMVYTWGDVTSKFDWASAMKPVMSTMLFFAVHEGKLPGVDALVNPYVEKALGKSLNTKDQTMTFRHLADMVSGYHPL
jgi:hypothetical protein